MRAWILGAAVLLGAAGTSAGGDWYIGAADPDERVTLDVDRVVDGSVYILNRGRLDVDGAVLTVLGDIVVAQEGVLDVSFATVRLVQSYSYERALLGVDSARIRFADSVVDPGYGLTYGVALAGDAQALFERVTVPPESGATWSFLDQGSLVMTDCVNANEFVPLGSGSITISGTDGLIFWFALPDGSVVDGELPPPGDVPGWSVGPGSPWAAGIPYSATLTDCSNVIWGVMARSGCDGTFRSSQIQAVGSYFERANDITIRGVANRQQLADSSFAWGDVALRFVDSSVESWNFYPYGTTRLTVEGCLFGELLVGESGTATVLSSLCDGTGGYIGASGDGVLLLWATTNLSKTTSEEGAVIWGVRSALLGPDVDAAGTSVMALLDTKCFGAPEAHEGATIFEASVEPPEGPAGGRVDLRGTARMLTGPDSPFHYLGYHLEYGEGTDPSEWFPIGGSSGGEVRDGTLGAWDARGLPAGPYAVRLSIEHDLGDPLGVDSPARLVPPYSAGTWTPAGR